MAPTRAVGLRDMLSTIHRNKVVHVVRAARRKVVPDEVGGARQSKQFDRGRADTPPKNDGLRAEVKKVTATLRTDR